jgi:hypothetical protein
VHDFVNRRAPAAGDLAETAAAAPVNVAADFNDKVAGAAMKSCPTHLLLRHNNVISIERTVSLDILIVRRQRINEFV